jgi:hypothetical protein
MTFRISGGHPLQNDRPPTHRAPQYADRIPVIGIAYRNISKLDRRLVFSRLPVTKPIKEVRMDILLDRLDDFKKQLVAFKTLPGVNEDKSVYIQQEIDSVEESLKEFSDEEILSMEGVPGCLFQEKTSSEHMRRLQHRIDSLSQEDTDRIVNLKAAQKRGTIPFFHIGNFSGINHKEDLYNLKCLKKLVQNEMRNSPELSRFESELKARLEELKFFNMIETVAPISSFAMYIEQLEVLSNTIIIDLEKDRHSLALDEDKENIEEDLQIEPINFQVVQGRIDRGLKRLETIRTYKAQLLELVGKLDTEIKELYTYFNSTLLVDFSSGITKESFGEFIADLLDFKKDPSIAPIKELEVKMHFLMQAKKAIFLEAAYNLSSEEKRVAIKIIDTHLDIFVKIAESFPFVPKRLDATIAQVARLKEQMSDPSCRLNILRGFYKTLEAQANIGLKDHSRYI